MKNIFPRNLIMESKKFLEKYEQWNEPTIFEVNKAYQLQAFQKDGYNMGILQSNWDKKIWTFVYRKKVMK